jgi:capsular polysaccharide biosynthesis protein
MQNQKNKIRAREYAIGMKKRSVKIMLVPVMMTTLAIFISACASTPAPTEQVAVSTAAVANATTAGAPELASAEMQLARQKLDRAKVAMTAEDYKLARSLSEEAQVDAQLAEAKALSGKARKAADELNESVRVLREELDRKAK